MEDAHRPEPTRGRLLVTGATGFAGHHMVMAAVRGGHRVCATDVSSRHYGALFEALGVEFRRSDLTRREGLEDLLADVDAVVHVAGIHDYSTPDSVIFAVNVEAVRNLCEAALARGVPRFVHVSSVGVYGFGWRGGRPVGEEAEKLTPPRNNYNVSKWRGEQVVRRLEREHGLRPTILRPAALYGPRSEYGLYTVFRRVCESGRRIPIAGRGDRIEAFLHVDDLCRAALFALENEATVGEAYNVADHSRITTVEFFRLVSRELFGREKPLLHVPLRLLLLAADASQWLARRTGRRPVLERGTLEYLSTDRCWDVGKLEAAGFKLAHPSAEAGLRDTLRWYVENGWLSPRREHAPRVEENGA